MEDTTGATPFALEPTGPDDLVQQLSTAGSRFAWWWPAALVGAVIALAINGVFGALMAALLLPACVWLYFNDQARRTVVLFYEVEDDAEQWFEALVSQWPWLSQSQGLWRVTESGDITTPYLHKRNAGASTLISSMPAAAGLSGPAQLRTNIQVPSIVAGKSALHFLPDRLLVRHGKRFTDVSYEHLRVFQTTVRFIEPGVPPPDGLLVATTWTYVNKDGGPDRRFNNNRQLPVMRYGRVVLTTAAGLYWIIQISRFQAAEPVAHVISLGSRYADQVRRNQDRSISINDAQIAARADRQNRDFLNGDPRGIYGQYPPAPLEAATAEAMTGPTSRFHRVSRVGKPRLSRDDAECEHVAVEVDVWPAVPDTRWWACFAQVVSDRRMNGRPDAAGRGGIATSTESIAAVPAAIAAIDSAIAGANALFLDAYARDEVETYVAVQRAAHLAQARVRAGMDLDSLAELLAKPDTP